EGARNDRLTSYAGLRRAQGCEYYELLALLTVKNMEICDPPLPDVEVEKIARSIMRYSPKDGLIQRDKDKAALMVVEGINRMAHEGLQHPDRDQVKHVIPEIVDDDA